MGCSGNEKDKGFVLKIRVAEEPDCLNPIVSQSSVATQIEGFIMPPLFEFNPDHLELSPLMVQRMSPAVMLNDTTVQYEYQILDHAVFSDGHPVSGIDVAFTVKAALNPHVKNGTWRGSFKNIQNVEIDPKNSKTFKISIAKNYMLSQELSGNFNIYPAHDYDPNHIMDQYNIPELVHNDSTGYSTEKWNALKSFAETFQSAAFCRDRISGAGAYELKSWQNGTKIILEKKKNWWGNEYIKDYPMLAAYPDQIEFWIMPDEAASVISLKDGTIDLMAKVNAKQFEELKKTNADQLDFITPTTMQYYYLELNTRNTGLNEKNVRKALASIIDVDLFIQSNFNGLAQRIIGPVHQTKTYYNTKLKPIAYDLEYATKLLAEAGWKDTDKDGILDKNVAGKKIKLQFKMLVAGKEIGKNLGIVLQENAKKIGIQIDLESKESALLLDAVKSQQFDIATMLSSQPNTLWDPFQSWHSSNTNVGGSNRCGFATVQTDSLITQIRNAHTSKEREDAYLWFQEILYEEQPQIFLFSTMERIAFNKRISCKPTSLKPGYVATLITKR